MQFNRPQSGHDGAIAGPKPALSRMGLYSLFAGLIIFVLGTLPGSAQTGPTSGSSADLLGPICSMIDTTARQNALPVDFFTRLIWQESRFHPDVIGPLTRSGQRAEGIAQFMPATAAERGLAEPFNPMEALPKSGEFLAELREEFGNLGLAAAAYNAGPQRLRDFLAGLRDLPLETRHYVMIITGHSVEEWATQVKAADASGAGSTSSLQDGETVPTCRDIVLLLLRAPRPSVAQMPDRLFPSWCKGLRHPNVSVCGPVHLIAPAIKTESSVTPRSRVHLVRSLPR